MNEPAAGARRPEGGRNGPGNVHIVIGSGRHGTVTGEDVRRARRRLAFEPSAWRAVFATVEAVDVAAELSVNLDDVTGCGPEDVITERDVRVAAGLVGPEAASGANIAELTYLAFGDGAHGSTTATGRRPVATCTVRRRLDAGAALAHLRRHNDRRLWERRVPEGVMLVAAAARALRLHPSLNAVPTGGRYVPSGRVDAAVDIAVDRDVLISTLMQDAARRGIDDLRRSLRERTDDRIPTVRMLQVASVDQVEPALDGTAAAIGFGAIIDDARIIDDSVVIRPTVTASVVLDRAAAGELEAAAFLGTLQQTLDSGSWTDPDPGR